MLRLFTPYPAPLALLLGFDLGLRPGDGSPVLDLSSPVVLNFGCCTFGLGELDPEPKVLTDGGLFFGALLDGLELVLDLELPLELPADPKPEPDLELLPLLPELLPELRLLPPDPKLELEPLDLPLLLLPLLLLLLPLLLLLLERPRRSIGPAAASETKRVETARKEAIFMLTIYPGVSQKRIETAVGAEE